MNVKFTITTSSKLPTLSIINGQLIYLEDINATYYDIDNQRRLIGGARIVSSLPSTGESNTVYIILNGSSADAYVWNSSASTYAQMSSPIASTAVAGIVKPDGTTISVAADGTISANGPQSMAATSVTYENTTSALAATNVQTAIDEVVSSKQGKLTAGTNITIAPDNTISATDTTYNTGTVSVAGLTKLYTSTGNNIDGTMTQYAITQAIGSGGAGTPEELGIGYGTNTEAASVVARAVTLTDYELITNGYVSVKFTNAVPASATLNVNSKGAKAIYYRGSALTAGLINAGDTALFVYDGTYYHLLSVDATVSGGGSGNSFIIADQTLSFNSSNIATVSNASVSANTCASVYYSAASLPYAQAAKISAETGSGVITFTAQTAPASTIVCDILCNNR